MKCPFRIVRQLLFLLAALSVIPMGCDRPFVEIEPPIIDVISPDLGEVQAEPSLMLRFRVTSLRRIARVEINGMEVSPSAEAGTYEFQIELSEGSNALVVDAFDSEGVVGSDTLFAIFLPYQTANILAGALPQALTNHSATGLLDGRLLVVGGFTATGGPSAIGYTYQEQGLDFDIRQTLGQLSGARGGHTASLLDDGRVLIAGGTSIRDPARDSDFVTTIEVYDPASDSFSVPSFAGELILRGFHTAATLTDAGRSFVYLYGGRGIVSSSAVQTRSDITVLEVKSSAAGDSVINISPGGAVGAFPAVAYHTQLPLIGTGNSHQTFSAGTYSTPDGSESVPVAFRFLYTPSTFFFPFEVFEEPLPPMQVPRIEHAAALFESRLAVLAGGRFSDGTVLDNLEVYSDEARRFFQFASSIRLRSARFGHTATLLPSGRILVLGGINAFGTTIASAEYILAASP